MLYWVFEVSVVLCKGCILNYSGNLVIALLTKWVNGSLHIVVVLDEALHNQSIS